MDAESLAKAGEIAATVYSAAKLLDSKTFEKWYDQQLANGPAKELSGMATDILKTGRLVTRAIYHNANSWLRTCKLIDEAAAQVPEDRHVQAKPEIAGPILEAAKYTEDGSLARNMFRELLSRSIDGLRQDEAHPAFPKIVEQLSRDEAMMIWDMSAEDRKYLLNVTEHKPIGMEPVEPPVTYAWSFSNLTKSDLVPMYYYHLQNLGLLAAIGIKEDAYQTVRIIGLNDFGKLFAQACIPPKGFPETRKGPASD